MITHNKPQIRFLSLLLSLVVIFTSLPFTAGAVLAVEANAEYGTEDNPYQISSYASMSDFLANKNGLNGQYAELMQGVTATSLNATSTTCMCNYQGYTHQFIATATALVTETNGNVTTKTLNMNGQTINLNGQRSIMVCTGSTLNIKNGTITGGCGVHLQDTVWKGDFYHGGAIYNHYGTLNIDKVTIKDCITSNGGGIYSYNSTLKLTDGNIKNCTATDSGGGGGIYNRESTLTMTGGSIENCTTIKDNEGHGGGIRNQKATATLDKVDIVGCKAARYGGGIYNNENSTLIMTEGSIKNCKASLSSGDSGGGIYNGDSSTATLTDVNIEGCAANNGGGIENCGIFTMTRGNIKNCTETSYGGGIANCATATLTNVNIADCKVYCEGGGINNTGTLTMARGSISNCTATDSGGGIYSYDAITTLTDVDIADCKADNGGGINNSGEDKECTLTMTRGSIKNCSATNNGGGIENCYATATLTDVNIADCEAKYGGGIYNDENRTLTMKGGSITGCKSAWGGGINNGGSLTLDSTSITENIVTDTDAEATWKNDYGGAGIDWWGGSLTVTGTTKIENHLTNGVSDNLFMEFKNATENIPITFGGLTTCASIGITHYMTPTYDSPINVVTSTSLTAADKKYFSSDDIKYCIKFEAATGGLWLETRESGEPAKITLTQTQDNLMQGEKATLIATATDKDGEQITDISKLCWKVEPEGAISFSSTTGTNVEITAIETGKAKVIVYSADDESVYATCEITVKGQSPDPPATTTYTITATATDGGTIAPSGAVKVEEGKSQSFTATANDNYTLEKFVVDGKDEYINGNTYTFENIAKNHTIQAVFAKKDEPTPPTPTPTPTDTGWKKTDDGKWQYLDENGKAVTGWQNSIKGWEGQWFYFDNSGIMQTGWVNNIPGWNDKWFYFDRNTGVTQRGWAFVDDGHGDYSNKLWYYLDPETGAMQTDWQKIDGKWYYLDYTRDNWGGAMQTGWQFLPYSQGQAWFCFASNGAMYENCITPDGYTVDASGVCKK